MFLFLSIWGVFENRPFLAKIQRVTPLKTQFWPFLAPLFWAVLDARRFFWTFFEKCPFGGGDQKKVCFLHFFVKIEKISKFYHFPLTDPI